MIPQPSPLYGGPLTGRHRAPLSRAVIARRAALLLLAVVVAIVLGVAGGTRDAQGTPGVPKTVTTPEHTTPGYEDERWQDPSGLPYCLADGSPQDLLPCIDAQTGEVTDALLEDDTPWEASTLA